MKKIIILFIILMLLPLNSKTSECTCLSFSQKELFILNRVLDNEKRESYYNSYISKDGYLDSLENIQKKLKEN